MIINEIMPAPDSPEPEWIELYIIDDSENLKNYTISDLTSTKEFPDILIPASTYVILTKSESDLIDVRQVHANALIIEMSTPSLNNSSDALILKSKDYSDSLYYSSSDYERGISIERADPNEPFLGNNIKICKEESGSTCGYRNSNLTKTFDLALIDVFYDNIAEKIICDIENLGKRQADNFQITFKSSGEDVFFIEQTKGIEAGEFLSIEVDYQEFISNIENSGQIELVAELIFEPDQDLTNNFKNFNLFISGSNIDLSINEIMYDVSGNNFEFVELYNLSDKNIDISGFRIFDAAADFDSGIIIDSLVVKAKNYALIAWDIEILDRHITLIDSNNYFISNKRINLNKSGDNIYIVDPNRNIIDSVVYENSWHESTQAFTENISLEKINPEFTANDSESWTSSAAIEGSTPGARNSVYMQIEKQGSLSASPNPFAPEGNFDENRCIILYDIPFSRSRIIAKIFNRDGIEVRELVNNTYSSAEGYFVWDGTDTDGNLLPVGAYVLYMEAVSLESTDVFQNKILIVLANK